MTNIDVLIITALKEEYDAASEVAKASFAEGYGIAEWEDRDTGTTSPYALGTYIAPNDLSMTIALARSTRMGSTAMGPVASSLVERLQPRCLAMCGVCAGNPADVALGDVIIAEMVYQYDEGKQKVEGFEGDHRQYAMADTWVRSAQEFIQEGLPSFGEPSEEEAKKWLLERLYAGDDPRNHPSRDRYFPRTVWGERVQAFEEEGLVRRNGLKLALTKSGRSFVTKTLFYDTEGPMRLPYEIKVGPIASGNVVVKDGVTWDNLKDWGVRSVLGLEMEAATIGSIAYRLRVQQWVVVKGVMDHADPRKDDRYKTFAARASAEVLFKFLVQQLSGDILMMRVHELFDRVNVCKERYWDIPKQTRIKYGLRPDTYEFGCSAIQVLEIVGEVLTKAFRGVYPFMIDTIYAPTMPDLPKEFVSLEQVVATSEGMVQDIEERLTRAK